LKFSDLDELSLKVGERVAALAKEAQGKDQFTIALSGGSLPKLLAKGLLQHSIDLNFSRWHVFFADERHVPHDHPDSNMLTCRQNFLDAIPGLNPDHVYGIDYSVPVEEAAKRYQRTVEQVMGVDSSSNSAELPHFDIIFLGMGPDGTSVFRL
jgi:6-phosphogluconolactonase